MLCPYCGKTMELGFIEQTHVFHGLRWQPEKRIPSKIPLMYKNNFIKLTSIGQGGRVTVYRCEECKKFIIDEKDILV